MRTCSYGQLRMWKRCFEMDGLTPLQCFIIRGQGYRIRVEGSGDNGSSKMVDPVTLWFFPLSCRRRV